MKKFLAVAAMLTVMAGAASAQGGGGGGRSMAPEARDSATLARAFNGITLTADQTAKAKDIIKAAREAVSALDMNAPDRMEKMQAVNAKRAADLKALLTSDAEKAKFDSNAVAGRGRRGGGN